MVNSPPSGSYPPASGILSEARYYSIDLVSGTLNSPQVELSFNTNGPVDENIIVAGNVHVMRATASTGPWTDENGTGVFSPAAPAGYCTSGITSIVSPTFFTLGYNINLFPITLGYFRGKMESNEVLLEWLTETENGNDYFAIERSSSELSFDSIGVVFGKGNSNFDVEYSFVDADPLPGVSYYRLRQTDFDGTVDYSNLVTIRNDELPFLTLYPNPGNGVEPIFLQLKNKPYAASNVIIMDVTGKLILNRNMDLSKKTDLSKEGFDHSRAKGVYFLKVSSGSFVETRKLVIE
jgi:hypothetical protein